MIEQAKAWKMKTHDWGVEKTGRDLYSEMTWVAERLDSIHI